jgi:Mg/Co/Ni transporter MgtE
LGEIEFRDTFKVVFKEFSIALACGIALAIVNFAKLMIFNNIGWRIDYFITNKDISLLTEIEQVSPGKVINELPFELSL